MHKPWSRIQAQHRAKQFSGYSQDQLLDQFRSENWKNYSDKEKQGILQEFENRNAAAQGREPSEVYILGENGPLGSYNAEKNRIGIALDASSYEALDSIVHEGNHAYQEHCIKNGLYDNDPTGKMIEVESARDDKGNMYNYRDSFPEYNMQVNELDSNNKAAEFMLSQADRYGDDPEYEKYLADRQYHFSRVNEDLDQKKELRDDMQSDQIDAALEHGDISQAEHDQLSERINNDNYMDREEIRSHELQDQIEETRQELENREQTQEENTAEERPEELLGISTAQPAAEAPSEEQQESREDLLGYGNGGQEHYRRGYDPERSPETLDQSNSESLGELAPSNQNNYAQWADLDESSGQSQWDSLKDGPSADYNENSNKEQASDLTGEAPVRDQNDYSAGYSEDNSEDNSNTYSF